VIAALHFKRNRPYVHMLVFVLLVSWISLAISAICIMPMAPVSTAMPEHMPGCTDSGVPEHTAKDMQDCTLKPCLDSQNHSFSDVNRLTKPDLPVLFLETVWTLFWLFLSYPSTPVPRKKTDPPLGRRVLLIYRFCTLLN